LYQIRLVHVKGVVLNLGALRRKRFAEAESQD
jgi:hypothetical protein